jgi:RNA polymerase sigma factor (sigma-70 family)
MTGSDAARERFSALYSAHSRDVLAYALRRIDPPAAAEVAADTFLVVWRRLDDVPPEPEARLWIFGAARRVLANERRSSSRRDHLHSRIVAAAEAAIRELDVTTADTSEVDAAMARLGGGDGELLRLTYWEGFTPAELAVVMGTGPSTVRSQLTRARQRFAQAYASEVVRSELEPVGHEGSDEHTLALDCEDRP